MNEALAREILDTGLNRYERRLYAGLLDGFQADFRAWPEEGGGREGPERAVLAERWTAFLRHLIDQRLANLFALRKRHSVFEMHHARAVTADERLRLILDYARDLGADGERLEGDREAFSRWFGPDAVIDRYRHHHTASERRIACALNRLGTIAALVLREAPDPAARDAAWRRLGLEATIRPLLAYDGDSRVCIEAFRALVAALEVLPPESQERSVADTTLQFIYRSAMDTRQQVWIQCEAVRLLRSLSPESFRKVVEIRLGKPGAGDDLFVRRRAVRLLGEEVARRPELAPLLEVASRDPGPFVRQAAAGALGGAPTDRVLALLGNLAEKDATPQVRASAVLEILTLMKRPELGRDLAALLSRVMRAEEDAFVLRVAAHVAVEGSRDFARSGNALLPEWLRAVREGLAHVHVRARSLSVRRWAAQARERIWCETDPDASTLRGALEERLRSMKPGRSYLLPRRLLRGRDEAVIGRVLSVMAQNDFGLDLERRWWGDVLTRGHVFQFRAWRFLHELRNPSPDKREGFSHTIGRVFRGGVRAPSAILSELAETKVPGEPLFLSTEGGWRPYLPLVDEALSCLGFGFLARTVRLYTSEGVTELAPPRWWILRVLARLRLTLAFSRYARLRNWREGEQIAPDAWTRALTGMGFRVRFSGHGDGHGGALSEDPSVLRFFPAPAAGGGGA